jgi:hypothetical protein
MIRALNFSTWTLLEHLFRLRQRPLAQEVRELSRVYRKYITRYKYQAQNVYLFSHHNLCIPAALQIGSTVFQLTFVFIQS